MPDMASAGVYRNLHRYAVLVLFLWLAVLCSGCFRSTRTDRLADVTPIPLTPTLRLLPTVTTASAQYQNACGDAASFSLAEPLSDAIQQKLRRVFHGVTMEPASDQPTAEGTIEVGLGFKHIDVAIPRQVAKAYPATITLGLQVVFFDADGTVLFEKKLQSAGGGDVQVTEQSCEVNGLEAVLKQAVDLVSEGMAKQVADSVRVREYAAHQTPGKSLPANVSARPRSTAADRAAPPDLPPADLPKSEMREAAPAPAIPPASTPPAAVRAEPGEPATVTFRTIIRDENRDQLIQPDEWLTIEVEVKNEGAVEAHGVEVLVGGTPALMEDAPAPLSFGSLKPGEVKRTMSTSRVRTVEDPLKAELVLTLRSITPLAAAPEKRFTVTIKPDKTEAAEPLSNVDQLPKPVAALKQPKALVVAIGVGQYRDEQVPTVKYAGHDAEVIAAYLQAIAGIPKDRVRVLTDARALKQDVVETFDEWIPKRTDPATVVYVFFAGRAVVDGTTGAVSLVPFDGTTSTMTRLYSIRRLQESLSRVPLHRAILMFDVSLEPAPGVDPANSALPDWETVGMERKDQMMWMVAHKGLQEAHDYEAAGHGLFTYQLLRGLQGAADVDRDGIVAAWELCRYAQGQVHRIAREQYGNKQEPLCLPPPGYGALVRIHPVAKGSTAKQTPEAKKESGSQEAAPSQRPTPVGPGQ